VKNKLCQPFARRIERQPVQSDAAPLSCQVEVAIQSAPHAFRLACRIAEGSFSQALSQEGCHGS